MNSFELGFVKRAMECGCTEEQGNKLLKLSFSRDFKRGGKQWVIDSDFGGNHEDKKVLLKNLHDDSIAKPEARYFDRYESMKGVPLNKILKYIDNYKSNERNLPFIGREAPVNW